MVVHRGAGLAMSDGHVANEELLVTEAKSWRLLFQASLPNWWQEEFTEGTVYFLIRDDDLTARDFDNIVAVYQQT